MNTNKQPTTPKNTVKNVLMEVKDLSVTFYTARGTFRAVRGISFSIERGEVLGLVGESGCGKSTVAFGMMGYLPDSAHLEGEILFDGENISTMSSSKKRLLRGNRIAMVYQDPATSLNPTMRVGKQINEVLIQHMGISPQRAKERTIQLFKDVGLPDPEHIINRYPHQLSGGMQQRVVIAMALACDPDLLIMDEPTTGLDVTTEATILDLVVSLKDRVNAGILYVSHNLGVIARVSDRVAVMYSGQIVEESSVKNLFENAKHPYTAGLLNCIPKPPTEDGLVTKLNAIPGFVFPSIEKTANMCLFSSRCPLSQTTCLEEMPQLYQIETGHKSRCFFSKDIKADIWGVPEPLTWQENALTDKAILEATGVRRFFGRWERKYIIFGPKVKPPVRAVTNIDFKVKTGKTLGIVGESGSGKTTVARMIVGLVPKDHGQILFQSEELGSDLPSRTREQLSELRMVFQNPTSSLNPKLPVCHSIVRSLRKFSGFNREESIMHAEKLFEAVGLDISHMNSRPEELSGGQQQRVALAGAFAGNPKLIVLDEAVSALDVSIQAQVLNLLAAHQHEFGTSYIFISHDLGVVRYVSDDILVLYAGHVAEFGPAEAVLKTPSHPYTEALLSAVPLINPKVQKSRIRLVGSVPTMHKAFKGCFFAGRCPRKIEGVCDRIHPPAQTGPSSPNHVIYCHIPLDQLQADQN